MLEVVIFYVPLIEFRELTKQLFLGNYALGHKLNVMGFEDEDKEAYDFLIEMQHLHHKMEMLIEKYNMRNRVLSVVVTGVLEAIDEDNSNMKALFSYNLGSREEVEVITEFIQNTFDEQEGPDLDDLLDDLGISLN